MGFRIIAGAAILRGTGRLGLSARGLIVVAVGPLAAQTALKEMRRRRNLGLLIAFLLISLNYFISK